MEKIYTVRIKNKYDTLENWNNSTEIPLQGELCIAEYTLPDNSIKTITKIGDGVHVFFST